MAWALFPPHTYLHGAHECGVGACWKLPKPARTIGPIKGIIQSNMRHHPFKHPCQSSNQPQPANQNRPAVPPTAPLSQTCLILHAQRRPAKPLRPRLTHAWRALTFIICFQPFDRCASRIAAQVQGFEAQKRAARHRPHPKGVYAANHTAPGQKGQQARPQMSGLSLARPAKRIYASTWRHAIGCQKVPPKAGPLIGRCRCAGAQRHVFMVYTTKYPLA